MKNTLLLLTLLCFSLGLNAQGVIGKWKTIDDETGKPKSIVEIYMVGDKLHGKLLKLYREEGEDPDPICDECTDDRKDQKVIGMEIIRDMEKDGSQWNDGTISSLCEHNYFSFRISNHNGHSFPITVELQGIENFILSIGA